MLACRLGIAALLERKKPLTRKKALGPGKKAGFGQRRYSMAGKSAHAPEDDDRRIKAHGALWQLLKDRTAFPFQEYERLGMVVTDFTCPAARIAVVIGEDAPALPGYRLFCFAADEVLADPQAVHTAITASFSLRIIG
jgi:Uncharacterized protein conserved in bacteria